MANRSSNATLSFPIYDIGSTVEDITANNVTVDAPRDTVLRVGRLGVTSGGGPNSRFEVDDCTVFMSGNGNHGFKQGFLQARRSKLILTSDVRFVWPANPTNNAGIGFNFDLQDAYLAAPNALTIGNGLVLHFGGAATTGTLNVAGVVFGPNVVPQTHPYIAWVNTTFSNSFSEASGGFNNYTRFVDCDTGMAGLQWSGFFGCDFTSWAENGGQTQHHMGTFACPWEDDLGSIPTIFVLNCVYDSAISQQKLYNSSGGVGREARWVSGRAWKPSFRRPDGTDTNANYKLDFGNSDVYDMLPSRDQTTTPTLHASSGGANVRDYRPDGWAIVEDSQIIRIDNSNPSSAANYDGLLDVAIAEKTPTVYAYEEETWVSGIAQTVTTVASPFADACVLGDVEGYVFAATAQTSIDKASAESYRAGIVPITTIDHLLAAARKDGFDQATDLLIYSPDAAAGAVTIPNATFTNDGASLSVTASAVMGNFNGLTSGTQYDTLTGNVTITQPNFTLSDITIDGDLTFNIPGNNTLNLTNVTVTGDVTNAGSGTLTINASGSSLTSSEAGSGPGQVDIIQSATLTITGLVVGSDIVIKDPAVTSNGLDNNVVARFSDVAGSTQNWTYSNAPPLIDVEIYRQGFKLFATRGVATGSDGSLPISQQSDPAYGA